MSTYKHRNKYLLDNNITYFEYLQSDHWKELKIRFRKSKLCNGKCYVCGSNQNIDIHHKTYKRIGNEYLMDLVELCRICHNETHKIERNSTNRRTNLWNAHKRLKKSLEKKKRKNF